LTPAGRALHDELVRARETVVCRTGLDGPDMAALRLALQALTENLAVVDEDIFEPM
jgi:hypothetical protein